ncbi:MAG: 30S ribosomal protein S20 [Candidatus Caenarcaniphilales bacterium]|nr:30S ribosomal protein S20 [Candidatus Caenarcaniphilales bacterium]
MANTKSAKKSILTSRRNRERNVARRSKIKTLIKKIKLLSAEEELVKQLSLVYKELDKVDPQAIHPNKASRLKSQAAKLVKEKLLKK